MKIQELNDKMDKIIGSMELGSSQYDLLNALLKINIKIFKEKIKNEYKEQADNLTIDSDELLREILELN